MSGRKVKEETGNVVMRDGVNGGMDEVNEIFLQQGWFGGITTKATGERERTVILAFSDFGQS